MSDGKDDARRAILARRARFVAAALAGVAASCRDAIPRPCLEPPPVDPNGVEAGPPPQVCLTPPMMPVDAGPAPSSTPEQPPPVPCLSVRPPTDAGPAPAPCLRVARPADAGATKTPPKPAPRPCLLVMLRDDGEENL